MSDLKGEWPYIMHMTIEDRKNYESDLPQDLNTLKVKSINPTPRWQVLQIRRLRRIDSTYLTPKDAFDLQRVQKVEFLGYMVYSFSLLMAIRSVKSWYKMDLHRNYVNFKNESWTSYISKRFWPGFVGLVMLESVTKGKSCGEILGSDEIIQKIEDLIGS